MEESCPSYLNSELWQVSWQSWKVLMLHSANQKVAGSGHLCPKKKGSKKISDFESNPI